MLTIYGSRLCPDCVKCCEDLKRAGVAFNYRDFGEDLKALKEFLAIRDSNPLFDTVRANGGIGIPCIVTDDNTVVLNWEEFM